MSTMTRPVSDGIRCGHCHDRHETIAEVRACAQGVQRPIPMTTADWFDERQADLQIQRREREEDDRVARAKLDRDVPEICSLSKPASQDGIYRNPQTGQIFKIYHTVHGRNVQVAKELVVLEEDGWYTKIVRGKSITVKAEFVYRGIAPLRSLTASMQMTLEEAKEYGAIYGVCIRCAATLTREESIERSMGPVCAKKENWA